MVKPQGLSDGASSVWDELAPVCISMGTLTSADVRTFATLCEMQASLQATSASKDGRTLFDLEAEDSSDRDSPMEIVVDAALKLEKELATSLRPYYEAFGMTPSGRARLTVPAQDEPVSKWA